MCISRCLQKSENVIRACFLRKKRLWWCCFVDIWPHSEQLLVACFTELYPPKSELSMSLAHLQHDRYGPAPLSNRLTWGSKFASKTGIERFYKRFVSGVLLPGSDSVHDVSETDSSLRIGKPQRATCAEMTKGTWIWTQWPIRSCQLKSQSEAHLALQGRTVSFRLKAGGFLECRFRKQAITSVAIGRDQRRVDSSDTTGSAMPTCGGHKIIRYNMNPFFYDCLPWRSYTTFWSQFNCSKNFSKRWLRSACPFAGFSKIFSWRIPITTYTFQLQRGWHFSMASKIWKKKSCLKCW